jgi:hypothetical protein
MASRSLRRAVARAASAASASPGEEPGETAELALAEVDDPTQDDAGQTPEPQRRQG